MGTHAEFVQGKTHAAQRYLNFLQKHGIKPVPASPIFNAASTRRHEARKRRAIKAGGKKKKPKLRKRKLVVSSQKFRPKGKLNRREWHNQFMKRFGHCLRTTAAADLRALPYNDFLQSDYWRCTRILVFRRDKYRCLRCGNCNQLQAHHTTYDHHGEEHLHLQDLQTLCDGCHAETHGIIHDQNISKTVNRIATTLATSTLTTSKPEEQDASGSGSRNSGHSPEAPMQPRLVTPPQRAAWPEWDSKERKAARSKVASPE